MLAGQSVGTERVGSVAFDCRFRREEAKVPAADRPGIPIDRAVPALEMRRVSKAFAGIEVLRNVDFTLRAGAVHALMGENGAGKSTLMKITGGLYDDYRGEIAVFGEPVRFASPRDAIRAGVAVIHQELNLVPAMSAAENIHLGNEKVRRLPFVVDHGAQQRAAAAILKTLNFQASPNAPVATLRMGEQQLVEIAKALAQNAQILVMDEPTSALSATEADRLHAIVRRLAAQGVGIVYISHRIEEVFNLADTISVLRDGALVGTLPAAGASRRDLIRMMVGQPRRRRFCLSVTCGSPTRSRPRPARASWTACPSTSRAARSSASPD
jgi:ribose transport system ATP-binding protein